MSAISVREEDGVSFISGRLKVFVLKETTVYGEVTTIQEKDIRLASVTANVSKGRHFVVVLFAVEVSNFCGIKPVRLSEIS